MEGLGTFNSLSFEDSGPCPSLLCHPQGRDRLEGAESWGVRFRQNHKHKANPFTQPLQPEPNPNSKSGRRSQILQNEFHKPLDSDPNSGRQRMRVGGIQDPFYIARTLVPEGVLLVTTLDPEIFPT